ncbi:MAG: CDP-archaeol synthase, partial [Candidatus Micrarchaeota archaeon]|nr:CDP-archaeol synthase [Candidatus Micrarchaeota archaeon]
AVPQFPPSFSLVEKIILSFLLSFGALLGDSIGSFIKRRRGMESGRESLVTDKVWFLVVSLIVAFPVYSGRINLELVDVVFLFVLTFFLHIAFNRIAHFLKLKKVPW